jgi:hypothetical protein
MANPPIGTSSKENEMHSPQLCHPAGLRPADGLGRRLIVEALPGHGIDDILSLDYFRLASNKTRLEFGDVIHVRAHDGAFNVELYVLGVRLEGSTVTKRTYDVAEGPARAVTALDHMITSLVITDAVSSFRRAGVVDHCGPSLERCVQILAELQRARDARLLSQLQYQAAAKQLDELVEDAAELRELAEAENAPAKPTQAPALKAVPTSAKASKPTAPPPT